MMDSTRIAPPQRRAKASRILSQWSTVAIDIALVRAEAGHAASGSTEHSCKAFTDEFDSRQPTTLIVHWHGPKLTGRDVGGITGLVTQPLRN